MKLFLQSLTVVALLAFSVASAAASEDDSSVLVSKLKQQIPANPTVMQVEDCLADYEQEYGSAIARRVAEAVYQDNKDNYLAALLVLTYCDPMDDPVAALRAAKELIRLSGIPKYSGDLGNDLPHISTLGNCESAYLVCMQSYFELNDAQGLYDSVDWLVSYAAFSENCFFAALNGCDYAIYFANEQHDADKVRYYGEKFEQLMEQYGEEYPEALKRYLPQYKDRILPLLEKNR